MGRVWRLRDTLNGIQLCVCISFSPTLAFVIRLTHQARPSTMTKFNVKMEHAHFSHSLVQVLYSHIQNNCPIVAQVVAIALQWSIYRENSTVKLISEKPTCMCPKYQLNTKLTIITHHTETTSLSWGGISSLALTPSPFWVWPSLGSCARNCPWLHNFAHSNARIWGQIRRNHWPPALYSSRCSINSSLTFGPFSVAFGEVYQYTVLSFAL